MSYQPSQRVMITKLGIRVTSLGIISVARKAAKRTFLPTKRIRAKAYAARVETTSTPSTVQKATKMVLKK